MGHRLLEYTTRPPLPNKKMRETSGREESATVKVGTGHHGCSALWTFIYPVPNMKIHQYLWETPVDEGRTRLVLVNTRNFMQEAANDDAIKERNEFVALQDRDVLLKSAPGFDAGNQHQGNLCSRRQADRTVSRTYQRMGSHGLAYRR